MFKKNRFIGISIFVILLGIGSISFSFYPVQAKTHANQFSSHSVKSLPNSKPKMWEARMAAEQAYQTSLAKFSPISIDKAKTEALQAEPGTKIVSIALRSLENNLVYLAILSDEKIDVIDAGNGKLLKELKNPIHPNELKSLKSSLQLTSDQSKQLAAIKRNTYQSNLKSSEK